MAATTTRTHRHSSKCTFVERENEDGKDETRDDEKRGMVKIMLKALRRLMESGNDKLMMSILYNIRILTQHQSRYALKAKTDENENGEKNVQRTLGEREVKSKRVLIFGEKLRKLRI